MMNTKRDNRFLLNGTWKFCMDPAGCGAAQRWYEHPERFTSEAVVPATIQEQDIGYKSRYTDRMTPNFHESFDDIDHRFLTTQSECYVDAWYTNTFRTPDYPQNKHLWLVFETIHPYGDIYLDDRLIHEHRLGPLEACRLDLTDLVEPGSEHRIGVHLLSDGLFLQGVVKWPYYSGLYRDVYLEILDESRFDDIYVHSDIHTGKVTVTIDLAGELPDGIEVQIDSGAKIRLNCQPGVFRYAATSRMTDYRLWSPDTPQLYPCTVSLLRDNQRVAQQTLNFGLRKLERRGKKLYLNDRPFYVRGTGFAGMCAGMPAPGKAREWFYGLVQRAKEYGFNYLRLHTYSMDPELLEAADALGFFLQSELFSVFYETQQERDITWDQCERMVRRNRNHPSVASYVMGNEHDHTDPRYLLFRDELCKMARRMAPGTLVIDADGVQSLASAHHNESDAIMAGGVNVGNVLDASPVVHDHLMKFDKPYLVHEFNYTESFPDVGKIECYTGMVRPFWLEHTLQSARANGTDDLLPDYVRSSERFHYKLIRRAVEDVRKVDGVSGFGHWGFVDHVHESIGLLDLFLNDKGGTAEDFRCVNSDVILALTTDYCAVTALQGQPFGFSLHVCNNSDKPKSDQRLCWQLSTQDEVVFSDQQRISYKGFGVTAIGGLRVQPPCHGQPYKAVLKAWLAGTGVRNQWDLWFFPVNETPVLNRRVIFTKDYWPTMSRLNAYHEAFKGVSEYALWDEPADAILVAPIITHAVSDYLARGGDVLLLPTYYGHSNPGLPMQPATFATMPSFAGTVGSCGTLINEHALLNGFPHEGYCDWQFYDLMGGERAPHVCVPFHFSSPAVFNLDAWPVKIEPILRSIPNWKKCYNRAYLFEAAVGRGRLLACAMRVFENLFTAPEARWFMDSMLAYLCSGQFQPQAAVTAEQFDELRLPVSIHRL